MAERFTVEVIKVKGLVNWAIKAVVGSEARYRGYYYKREAIANLPEWERYHESPLRELMFRDREFHHNFNSAAEMGIEEVRK